MFPGMTYCILSTDPDFVADMTDLLRAQKAQVFVAQSCAEWVHLQRERGGGRDARAGPLLSDPVTAYLII